MARPPGASGSRRSVPEIGASVFSPSFPPPSMTTTRTPSALRWVAANASVAKGEVQGGRAGGGERPLEEAAPAEAARVVHLRGDREEREEVFVVGVDGHGAPQASWNSGGRSRSCTRFGGIDHASPPALAWLTHAQRCSVVGEGSTIPNRSKPA